MQGTSQLRYSTTSIILNSAHFSPLCVASALFSLEWSDEWRQDLTDYSSSVDFLKSRGEKKKLLLTSSCSCFQCHKFLAAGSKTSTFPRDQHRSHLDANFMQCKCQKRPRHGPLSVNSGDKHIASVVLKVDFKRCCNRKPTWPCHVIVEGESNTASNSKKKKYQNSESSNEEDFPLN